MNRIVALGLVGYMKAGKRVVVLCGVGSSSPLQDAMQQVQKWVTTDRVTANFRHGEQSIRHDDTGGEILFRHLDWSPRGYAIDIVYIDEHRVSDRGMRNISEEFWPAMNASDCAGIIRA